MIGNTQQLRNCFIVLAIVYVSLSIIGGFRYYSAVPWLDTWDGYIRFFLALPDSDWHLWWSQHKEHRIVLPRLFFWIDFTFFKGLGAFLIVLHYLLLAASVAVLYLYLAEQLPDNSEKLTRQVLALVMLALAFSWMQRTNLLWSFQSQFFLAQLLPLLAFYLLHKSYGSTTHNTLYFVLATLAAIASLGSMANGILVLPLLAVMAALLRMHWQRIAMLAILASLCTAAYLYHYVRPATPAASIVITDVQVLDFPQYVLLFLGNPFYYMSGKLSGTIAFAAGLFLIGSVLWFAWQIWQTKKVSSLQLALLTFISFIAASALAAASSRIDEGLNQALTARYTTPTTFAWLCLLVLYAPIIHKKTSTATPRILWCFLLMLLLLLPLQLKTLRPVADRNAGFNLAALALTLGIRDTPIIQLIYPYEKRAAILAAKAADKKMSVFANPPLNDARERLGQLETERTAFTCTGALQTLTQIVDDNRYYQVQGWLESSEQRPAAIRILDQQGVVVGFALSGFTRTDTIQSGAWFKKHSGFVGYVQADQIGKPVIFSGKHPDCELTAQLPGTANTPLTRSPYAASTRVGSE